MSLPTPRPTHDIKEDARLNILTLGLKSKTILFSLGNTFVVVEFSFLLYMLMILISNE